MMKRIGCLILAFVIVMGAFMCGSVYAMPEAAVEEPTISEAYIPSEAPTEPVEEVIVLEPSVVERVETTDLETLAKLVDECEARISEANKMSEAAQALGYEENHPVIVLAETEKTLAEKDLSHYSNIVEEEERKIEEAKRLEEQKRAEEAKRLEEQKKAEEAKRQEEKRKAEEAAVKQVSSSKYPEATQIWNYLKNLGYNDYVCAGIMGNIMAEVGGQSLNIRPGLYSSNGYYYGICQWNKKYYGSVHGSGLSSQLNFLRDTIKSEMNTYGKLYRSGFDYQDFLSLKNEKEAALAFAKAYERCGSGSYDVRKSNATKALNYFAG